MNIARNVTAVVFACACACAFAGATDWYDPSGNLSKGGIGVASMSVGSTSFNVYVDENGNLSAQDDASADAFAKWEAAKRNDPSFQIAANALEQALKSEVMIKNMATRLNAMFNGGNISVSYGDGSASSTLGISYNGDGSVSFNVNGLNDNAKADGSTTEKTGDTISVKVDGIVDNTSVGVNSSGKAEINNWSTAPTHGTTIADALKKSSDPAQSFQFVARSSGSAGPYYVMLGKLGDIGGGVKADGESIVTNETADGSASLAGFQTEASNGSIPYADGSSLKWTSLAQGGILEMRESSPRWTSTTGTDMYFGTAHNGGGMAWHPLPNVTTNAVEADGITLKEINVAHGRKQFAINDNVGDGVFGWTSGGWVAITMPALTNHVYKADGVSISQTTEGTNTTFSINGFGDESNRGVIVKNYGALEYWPIEAGGGLEQDDTEKSVKFTVSGWDSPQCSTSIAAMLTSNKTDRATHRVLCRRTTARGTEMHYASIGELGAIGGSGCALRFIGTDGTGYVAGSGSVTNNVTFASADDSNVKVDISRENEADVKITIGVYYK